VRRRAALAGLSLLLLGSFWPAAGEAAPPVEGVRAPDAVRIICAPRSAPLSGPALDQTAVRVASLLRCPVCQGLSVNDSPTGLAQGMKAQVRQLLAAGYDQEQVLTYFEKSYGEFVRLEPPRRGINWLVWLAPAVALLGGGIVVVRSWRRLRGDSPAAAAMVEAAPAVDPQLEPYLLLVREMAYGWPGGRPPAPDPAPVSSATETAVEDA